jgi:hypothetical protein
MCMPPLTVEALCWRKIPFCPTFYCPIEVMLPIPRLQNYVVMFSVFLVSESIQTT